MGQITANTFHAIFFLMFASILEPNKYGELSFWISVAGMASVLSRFGMTYTVTVYQAKGNSILSNQANVLVIITSGFAALILLPIDAFAAFLSLGFSFFYMNQYNLLGLKKYKKLAITLIIRSILFILLPILFYFTIGFLGILLGIALANIICSFSYIKSLDRKINSFNDLKNNFKVIIHNFGVELSLTLPTLVDKLVIVPLLGFITVGIYTFNFQILVGLGVLPAIIHGFLLTEESNGRISNKIIYLVIMGSVILVILTIIFSPFLVNLFFPKFIEGIQSLQIIIISLIPLSISSIFNAKLQAHESIAVGYSLIVRIGSLLVLIVILGNLYGLTGLSLAVLISTSCYAAFLYYLYRKIKI